MRAVSACLLFAIAAAVVSAQCTAPSSDPLNPTTTTGCSSIQTCQSNLCACTGSSGSYPSCLTTNTGNCSATQTCFVNYFGCLAIIGASRSNVSANCSTYASNLYMAQLSAASSISTFSSTTLYNSCVYDVCSVGNSTGNIGSCGITTIVPAAVCTSSNLLAGTTSTAPPTTASPPTYDIIVTLTLSGSNWSFVLTNATLKAQCIAGLTADIATLIGVAQSTIVILALSIGSLIVNFGVLQGNGKSPAQLAASINTATSSISWLSSTSAVYSTVGNDFKTVSATINSTAAPTTLAPGQTTPAPTSSAMGAAGALVAAVVAVLALWA